MAFTMGRMDIWMLLAKTGDIWTDWIAFPLLGLTLVSLLALAVGYVVKVIAPKYPKK